MIKFVKKKRIFIGCFIIIIIGFLLLAYEMNWFHQASYQQKADMTLIEESNGIIYYYGNLEPGKEVITDYKKVTEFTEESIGDLKKNIIKE